MLTHEQRLAMLDTPSWPIDIIIDSDTFNEIDDQFAISYALRSQDRLNVKAIYAAPFLNQHSVSPEDGMERVRRRSASCWISWAKPARSSPVPASSCRMSRPPSCRPLRRICAAARWLIPLKSPSTSWRSARLPISPAPC